MANLIEHNLTEFRKSKNLTQTEMAKKIGVSISYYSKVESGHKQPSFQFLKKLKGVYRDEVSVDEVFF